MVQSDYSYDARFHRYKSFKFASNSNFKGSEADKDLFEKYVGSVLSAWGYRPRDKKPDLYVFVTIVVVISCFVVSCIVIGVSIVVLMFFDFFVLAMVKVLIKAKRSLA